MPMNLDRPHISICICTYKRPELLKRLLAELARQDTQGLFTYSIVVAENDNLELAKAVVSDFAIASAIPATYCLEPRRNIGLARNKTIENATGDFIAFIDDDEFPEEHWLLNLFEACNKYGVDGVLGPVVPYFPNDAPAWIVKGRFYDRPIQPTGLRLVPGEGRTGNVLIKRRLFAEEGQRFDPENLGAADREVFRTMMHNGYVFVWCREAVVYEVIPPSRWKRTFLIKRALFRGVFSFRTPLAVAQSLAATPVYLVSLPLALVLGQARFMKFVFKLCYHVGRLLGSLGINPIRQPYVT
jgi:succinoglycan biosynthesis protein ExoM